MKYGSSVLGYFWSLAKPLLLLGYGLAANKPVALVCHAPGVLRHVKGADGQPLVKGRRVTGFTNTEEAAVQLTDVVPFLVEDMLQGHGATFSRGADWSSYTVTDGRLVTGQNPASSEAAAHALIGLLST